MSKRKYIDVVTVERIMAEVDRGILDDDIERWLPAHHFSPDGVGARGRSPSTTFLKQ